MDDAIPINGMVMNKTAVITTMLLLQAECRLTIFRPIDKPAVGKY